MQKIALIPFYLRLYDEVMPQALSNFAPFLATVTQRLEAQCLAVRTAPVCRVAAEFAAAVAQAERDGAECLVTLHLAYSPSLEALEAFRNTELPVVILDTTMDHHFGIGVSPDRITYNHGIHGVMDFASVLRRSGRPFEIVAGSPEDPTLFGRVADRVRSAVAARALRGSRVLRLGEAFAGMGDFTVPEMVLRERLGIVVEQQSIEALDQAVQAVTPEAVAAELVADRARYQCDLPAPTHERSVRVGLGLRTLLTQGG